MGGTLALIALRLALCLAVLLPVWWWIGPAGLALTAPLFGVALARPLLDLISQTHGAIRERAYAATEGRYYAHKGVPIDVIEGEDGHRWLRVADVRRIVPGFGSDALLAKTHPGRLAYRGAPPSAYLQDDALLAQIVRALEPATLAFRHWVERDIVFPARRRRGERDDLGATRSQPADPTLAGASGPNSTASPPST
jgi:hypothetical protein